MTVWPTNVRDWIEVASYIVVVAAAVGSAIRFYTNSREARIRWLFELYLRFYDDPMFRSMRVRIEEGDTHFVREEKDFNLLAEFDDYLNFFEFLGLLQERKLLNLKELKEMFDYPLRQIAKDERVMEHIKKTGYGYERLRDLLKKLSYPS